MAEVEDHPVAEEVLVVVVDVMADAEEEEVAVAEEGVAEEAEAEEE